LGLAIVDKVAKVLEHEIQVKSVQGKGSVFSVIVPLGQMKQVPQKQGQLSQVLVNKVLAHSKVWLVDNDANICEGMTKLLEGWDCNVVSATNLEHLHSQVDVSQDHADILMVDYHLDDGENGLDVAKEINKLRQASLPVLMITANYSKSLKAQVKDNDILLLNKPVKPMKLKTSMLYLLR